MDYSEAFWKFQRLPQGEKMRYIALVKEGKTNLIAFISEYESSLQRQQEEEEIQKVVEESAHEQAIKSDKIIGILMTLVNVNIESMDEMQIALKSMGEVLTELHNRVWYFFSQLGNDVDIPNDLKNNLVEYLNEQYEKWQTYFEGQKAMKKQHEETKAMLKEDYPDLYEEIYGKKESETETEEE